jgi:hypothetical protein
MITFWNALDETPNTQCTAWKKWAFSRIQQFDPSIVVATTDDHLLYDSGAHLASQRDVSKGLVTTLKDLSAPGRRVVLLGDIPYLSQVGPICLAAHEGNVQACSTPTNQAVFQANQAAEESAAAKSGAQFIDVIPWLCTPHVCPPIIGNVDVYADGGHITATYGISLEPVLTEALGLTSG